MKEKDREHLSLLATFHYIVAGMIGLFSCFALIYMAIGVGLVAGKIKSEDATPLWAGWLVFAVGFLVLAAGWTVAGFMIAAGRSLKAHRRWTFCVVVAAVECMFMPFGTALGIFTLVMLNKTGMKKEFGKA